MGMASTLVLVMLPLLLGIQQSTVAVIMRTWPGARLHARGSRARIFVFLVHEKMVFGKVRFFMPFAASNPDIRMLFL